MSLRFLNVNALMVLHNDVFDFLCILNLKRTTSINFINCLLPVKPHITYNYIKANTRVFFEALKLEGVNKIPHRIIILKHSVRFNGKLFIHYLSTTVDFLYYFYFSNKPNVFFIYYYTACAVTFHCYLVFFFVVIYLND